MFYLVISIEGVTPTLGFCSKVHFVAYLLAVYTVPPDATPITGNLLVFWHSRTGSNEPIYIRHSIHAKHASMTSKYTFISLS